MAPKIEWQVLSAADLDRLIKHSEVLLLANAAHACAAREVLLRIRNYQAGKGARSELLNRLDRYILTLPETVDIEVRLLTQSELNFIRQ